LHFILSISHPAYGDATSLSRLTKGFSSSYDPSREVPQEYRWSESKEADVKTRRANATIIMLARNSDLKGMVKSMKQMEDRFNKQFRYPYTFLNEVPFSDTFKECVFYSARITHKLITS
jgi:alpha 1,2-mannosyltransferase